MQLTLADVAVIVVSAALVGVVAARTWAPGEPAREFEVRSGNDLVGRYPLLENRELAVPGARGTTLLVVDDGRVRFRDSPCRNQVCVHRGWLSQSGDGAACLPNRVSIRLLGELAAVDTMSF